MTGYNERLVAQVHRKAKPMAGALRVAMIVFAVLFILMGIAFSTGFMLPGFLLVVLYLIFNVFSRKDYEYVLTGETFAVDVIWGRRYRRNVQTHDLNTLEVVAPHWHEAVSRYRKHGAEGHLPKFDYTSYDDDIPYYTMIFAQDGRKCKLLLDLNDEFLQTLKRHYPSRVYMQ